MMGSANLNLRLMRKRNMAARNITEFNGIIDAIYAGSTETPRWRSFLRHLTETTGSMYACISFGDEESWNGRTYYFESEGHRPARPLEDGQDHSNFLRLSPFTSLPQGVVMTIGELAGKGRSVHPDFVSQVLRPFGIGDIIGVNLVRDGTQVANLRLGRRQTAGRYSSDDRGLCALVLPHLRRVCAENSRANNSLAWEALLFETLRSLGVGVFLVDASRKILDASGFALEIMDAHRHLLSSGSGRLRLQSHGEEQLFAAAVCGVLGSGDSQAFRVSGNGPGEELCFVCVRAPDIDMDAPQRSVIVFVSCERQSRPIAAQTLRGLFGLSGAEAQVTLGLISGLSIADVATTNAISRNTVYSHLKSAFDKVGVSQQSALVSRVLRSIAMLGRA